MLYISVTETSDYNFYYNMESSVHHFVEYIVGKELLKNRPINDKIKEQIQTSGYKRRGQGRSEYGMFGSLDRNTRQIEYASALDVDGITGDVAYAIADEVLELAKYYCPKDTGTLANSGRIEMLSDSMCSIVFDCPYAWYVHELSWKKHEFPTCDHFLSRAIYEVENKYGLRKSNIHYKNNKTKEGYGGAHGVI